MDNEVYNGKFVGNIVIVGLTACGETFFTQNLVVNIFFGKLKKTEWVSYIELTKKEKLKWYPVFHVQLSFITHKIKMI